MNYLYDESFHGFLTCVYHHWYTGKAKGIFPDGDYQLDLGRFAMTVETETDKAERVLFSIIEKISEWDAQRVFQVFCSNEPEKEMKLIRYLELGFRKGPKTRLLHGNPVVKAVEAAERRVGMEVHRLCGLIRFSEIEEPGSGNPILYSKIEPDNDCLEFLAPHFSDRYKNEPFIIHDLGRSKALFSFHRNWEVAPFTIPAPDTPIKKTERESGYSALWKQYFEVMATRERINPKCQLNFMPARYWKHLTEMDPKTGL